MKPTLLAQRGGTLLGLALGLLIGLGIALAVALYVSKMPVPFVDRLPQRTADQDTAEAERNRNWNPNAALSGKTPIPVPSSAASDAASGVGAPEAGATTPGAGGVGGPGGAGGSSGSGGAGLTGAAAGGPGGGGTGAGTSAAGTGAAAPGSTRNEVTGLFVQAGAYSRLEDAEQQRARLAMLGFAARISEREQGGKLVYRVRVGPFETRDETQGPMDRLMAAGIEVSLVRVERSATP